VKGIVITGEYLLEQIEKALEDAKNESIN